MDWCKLYARYPHDAAIIAAGEPAEVLFLRSMAYCTEHDTEGFVPSFQLNRFGLKNIKSRMEALVREGLWTTVDNGWLLTKWVELQAEVTSMEKRRRSDRLRKQSVRHPDKSADKSTGQSAESPHAPSLLSTTGSGVIQRREPRVEKPTDSQAHPSEQSSIQTLLGEWIDHCSQRPPNKVIGQISRELKTLIEDGYSPESLRAGLADWHRKGIHPATLPSVVHALVNSPARSTTDKRVADGLSVVQRFAEIERKELA